MLIQVSPGDLIVTEKLRFVDVNDRVKIQRVFMLGSRYESIIGRPLVPGAFVTAAIEVRADVPAKLSIQCSKQGSHLCDGACMLVAIEACRASRCRSAAERHRMHA